MALLGIEARRRRLEGPSGRYFLLALDHGLPAGPLSGIENPARLLRSLRGSSVSGVIANSGLVRFLAPEIHGGLVVHLSAGTVLGLRPTSKVLASSVERAVRAGADAVSVQVHFGDPTEDRMLSDAGGVVEQAHGLGVPVLIMAYPPSEAGHGSEDLEAARHAARAAVELGADLVQTNFAGPAERVREIVRGCPAPLLLAGGPKAASPEAFLESVRAGIAARAAGVTVGRNLFQHPDHRGFAERIGAAVFGASTEIAMEVGG